MMRSLSLLFLLALGLSTQTLAHTGVPSEPSGLHPIFHGDELVGGYTSKGYVHFPSNTSTPTWRRAPATTGMYVAAYGTPTGRSYALTSAGLWEVSDGGCTYTEAETQFGPMTLVQSAFNPTGNYLSWIGATASNGKPILYHSLDGESWNRILSLPAGLGWRGMLWEANQTAGLAVFRAREQLLYVSLKEDGTIESEEALPSSLPLEAMLLASDEAYTVLYFRAAKELDDGETLWRCDRMEASCALVYDSPDKLFHALWLPDSETIAWMDESGGRKLLELDGSLRADLESVGYFNFLPNLGNESWFMKKTPAEHAFSRLNALGEEIDWLKFEDIAIDPCPPMPGEEIDETNPFDETTLPADDDGTIDDTTPNETEESDSNDNEMNTPGSSGEGGCQGSAMGFWPILLSLLAYRRQK
ncbi:MAG: hypothetical protein VX210_19045 [Myxococcota bacterium]|nr:hypothetical protein [Myxococcota bacterium]